MTTATSYRIPQVSQEAIEVLENEIVAANQQVIEAWTMVIRSQQKLAEAGMKFWFQALSR